MTSASFGMRPFLRQYVVNGHRGTLYPGYMLKPYHGVVQRMTRFLPVRLGPSTSLPASLRSTGNSSISPSPSPSCIGWPLPLGRRHGALGIDHRRIGSDDVERGKGVEQSKCQVMSPVAHEVAHQWSVRLRRYSRQAANPFLSGSPISSPWSGGPTFGLM